MWVWCSMVAMMSITYHDSFLTSQHGESSVPKATIVTNHYLMWSSDASGAKMKELSIEMNITPSAVEYLSQKVPQKS